jgi:hypothetical protein
MPFRELYDAVQLIPGRISTNTLRVLAIEHSEINDVKEQWSSVVDTANVRGFYIEGPIINGPILRGPKEALIVLSRSMCKTKPQGRHWRRFVLTKELMHVFDTEEEKAKTPDELDLQIERLNNPAAPISPQFIAELKAHWRVLAVLCQEERRKDYKRQLEADEISFDVVAAALQVPTSAVRDMMQDNYDKVLPVLF